MTIEEHKPLRNPGLGAEVVGSTSLSEQYILNDQNRKTIDTILRMAELNEDGMFNGGGVFLLPDVRKWDNELVEKLRSIHDQLSQKQALVIDWKLWKELCVTDGIAFGACALDLHNDDGLDEFPNRLLVLIKAGEGYALEASLDNQQFTSVPLQTGQLIAFNESKDHLVRLDRAQERMKKAPYAGTGKVPYEQLNMFVSLPDPSIPLPEYY